MNSSRYLCLTGLLATGLLTLACSDSFEDAPATVGGAGSSGTGGTSSQGGSGGTNNGGASGDAGQGGAGGQAGTGGTAGGAGAGGDVGGAGGNAGQGAAGTAGSAGVGGSAGTGPDPCPSGYGDCDNNDANGCETPLDTVENCGSCATVCSDAANANTACDNGTCTLVCTGTYEDCDGDSANGCEADVTADPSHCGACNDPCPSGGHGMPTCGNSTCGIDCATGWDDCDASLDNGCEIDLNTDPLHCGACSDPCTVPANAVATCTGMQCGFTCLTGFDDCDGEPSNGCETNLNEATSHCGACNNHCGYANGTPSCSGGACSIQCNTNWGDCDGINGNGCETNLTNNSSHCGTCGHDCLGGGCSTSRCTAWTLATTTNYPSRIAVGATHVYYAEKTGIYRVPLAGGVPEFLVASSQASSLAIDTTYVYWSTLKNTADNAVYRAPLAGGTPYTIQANIAYPRDVAVDDSFVYWCYENGIDRRSKTSTTVTHVLSGQKVDEIELGQNNVYFVEGSADGTVGWVAKTGGPATNLNTLQNRPTDIAIDDEWVYFPAAGAGIIKKVRKSGTGTTVLASGYDSPVRLAIDDQHVFFTDSDGGLVVQIPKTYGPAIVRHSATDWPYDIQVSNGVVYWAGIGDRTIVAMVK